MSLPMSNQIRLPSSRLGMNPLTPWRQTEKKVVVVMGATGTGKSRLSVDIATRFPAEIVNSDKMQVYEGLDIVTNKITAKERCGVPHHLLGIIDPNTDYTSSDFCKLASLFVDSITNSGRIPVVVGGSNSYIETLIDNRENRFCSSYYDCCFLWIDVEMPELCQFISERVDKMVKNGMVDEVRQLYHPNSDYTKGIRKAIGVPEFDKYFKCEHYYDNKTRAKLLKEAINEVKENTCKLAKCQLKKIHRLKNVKRWKIHRVDATEVFRLRGKEADEAWDELVAEPSAGFVRQFLNNGDVPSRMRIPAAMRSELAAVVH